MPRVAALLLSGRTSDWRYVRLNNIQTRPAGAAHSVEPKVKSGCGCSPLWLLCLCETLCRGARVSKNRIGECTRIPRRPSLNIVLPNGNAAAESFRVQHSRRFSRPARSAVLSRGAQALSRIQTSRLASSTRAANAPIQLPAASHGHLSQAQL
jgi:hypothetical protein